MVPLSSYGIPRVPHYSGFSLPLRRFTYKTITFSGLSSHTVQLQLRVDYAVQNPGNITTPGLASFAFARRYWQNLGWFLFLALLRCFSSGGSLRITMYSLYGQYPCRYWGFPIRKSTDHNLFAVPRGLSQPITSFFGSQWQGIHPVLFLAWPSVCSAPFWQTPQKHLYRFLFSEMRSVAPFDFIVFCYRPFVRSTYTSTPIAPKERFFAQKSRRRWDSWYFVSLSRSI